MPPPGGLSCVLGDRGVLGLLLKGPRLPRRRVSEHRLHALQVTRLGHERGLGLREAAPRRWGRLQAGRGGGRQGGTWAGGFPACPVSSFPKQGGAGPGEPLASSSSPTPPAPLLASLHLRASKPLLHASLPRGERKHPSRARFGRTCPQYCLRVQKASQSGQPPGQNLSLQ